MNVGQVHEVFADGIMVVFLKTTLVGVAHENVDVRDR